MDSKQIREYGGFLPLELNPGKDYFERFEEYTSRFNTFKSSIRYLINQLGLKEIYLPYYYCPSTIEKIRTMVDNVTFYHIDEKMRPIDVPDKENTMIVIADFFGACDKDIKTFVLEYSRAEIIIDRAHNFFGEPIIKENVHNIYAPKKFFGIPDGSYLISSKVNKADTDYSESYQFAEYLLKSYECGTNSSYKEKRQVDMLLADSYLPMSKLAEGLLCNVDYEYVRKTRQSNYDFLHNEFRDINILDIPDNVVAYHYPLLILEKGRDIKKRLINDKIFVPTLWNGDDLVNNGNDFEISMMKDGIFLPVDQRYNESDMQYIINKIKNY